jgi:DNA replication protein DnaC
MGERSRSAEDYRNAGFLRISRALTEENRIITSNLETERWYELFDNKPLVDALLDRLQHHCITIRITGPSLRSPQPPSPLTPPADPAPPSSRRQATPAK